MRIDAVLLTGGESRRMGADKASLEIEGEAMGQRIARELATMCGRVTVLGQNPIPPYEFLADEEQFSGPLIAVSRYVPSSEAVFLASCDLPVFDARIVTYCASVLSGHGAAIPIVQDKWQPLCGLYCASAFQEIAPVIQQGKRNLMAWLDRLKIKSITANDLQKAGLDPRCVMSANSMAELQDLLQNEPIR